MGEQWSTVSSPFTSCERVHQNVSICYLMDMHPRCSMKYMFSVSNTDTSHPNQSAFLFLHIWLLPEADLMDEYFLIWIPGRLLGTQIQAEEVSTGDQWPSRSMPNGVFCLHDSEDYGSHVNIFNVMWLCCPPVAASWGAKTLFMPVGSTDVFSRSPHVSTCCSWPHLREPLPKAHRPLVCMNLCPTKEFWTFLLFHPRAEKQWDNSTPAFQISEAFFPSISCFQLSPR